MSQEYTSMRRQTRKEVRENLNFDIKYPYPRGVQSPAYSECSLDSTSCMFSGKKRRRNLSRSAPKQRYLKTNTTSQLDFSAKVIAEEPKTKKQYWTEEEVRITPNF